MVELGRMVDARVLGYGLGRLSGRGEEIRFSFRGVGGRHLGLWLVVYMNILGGMMWCWGRHRGLLVVCLAYIEPHLAAAAWLNRVCKAHQWKGKIEHSQELVEHKTRNPLLQQSQPSLS